MSFSILGKLFQEPRLLSAKESVSIQFTTDLIFYFYLNEQNGNGEELHVLLLQLLTCFCSSLMTFRENDEENLAHTVFTQYINEEENQMEAELAFDASFFKANRKVNCI